MEALILIFSACSVRPVTVYLFSARVQELFSYDFDTPLPTRQVQTWPAVSKSCYF